MLFRAREVVSLDGTYAMCLLLKQQTAVNSVRSSQESYRMKESRR